LVHFTAALLQFHQLRLIFESIKEHDSAIFRQLKSWNDMWRTRFVGPFLGLKFLIKFHGLRCGFSGLPLFGKFCVGVPVHHGIRDFLPFAAFSAEIADPVALDLPLCRELVGTVLQNEALGELLASRRATGEHKPRQDDGDREVGTKPHTAYFSWMRATRSV